jgi:hypothetical protein
MQKKLEGKIALITGGSRGVAGPESLYITGANLTVDGGTNA